MMYVLNHHDKLLLVNPSPMLQQSLKMMRVVTKVLGNMYQRGRDHFFYIRVFNPNSPSYRQLQLNFIYRKQEREKRTNYEQRIREVELASFTPLVFSTSGGMGKSTSVTHKRLASLLSIKRNQPYSLMLAWLRCCFCFSLSGRLYFLSLGIMFTISFKHQYSRFGYR